MWPWSASSIPLRIAKRREIGRRRQEKATRAKILTSTTPSRSMFSPTPRSRFGKTDTGPVLYTRAVKSRKAKCRPTFPRAQESTISSSAIDSRRRRPRMFMPRSCCGTRAGCQTGFAASKDVSRIGLQRNGEVNSTAWSLRFPKSSRDA